MRATAAGQRALSGDAAPSRAQTRPLRKDAQRNLRRLMDAARAVFAEQGIDASLEEIARRAEVGIGTLYRRFPTRTAIVEALFAEKATEYAAASRAALGAEDAWRGFASFVERLCEMQAEDRGFCDVLQASFPDAPGLYPHMHEAYLNITRLVARARREGVLRSEATPADVFWMMVANSAYLQATRGIAPDAWRRYVAVMLDGLRATGFDELPPAPTEDQIDEAVGQIRRAAGR